MTRAEFIEMIRSLVAAETITLLQASSLKHMVDIGDVAIAATSLPWRDLPGRLTREEFKDALRSAAVFLTPKNGGERLLASGEKPYIRKETPPEVKKILRERLRNHFRGDYEATMNKLAKGVSSGGDVRAWHREMARENRAYIARMMTAGAGRALAEEEINEVNRLALNQGRFLKGFADSVSARRILGIDYSEKYIAARSRSYGGVGWAAWFKGNESVEGQGDGKVIKYIAVDDPRTCSPCHNAEIAGPYLPGASGIPYPGEVCLGHGHCRCRHEIVYDMDAWRELKGLAPKAPAKPPKTEEEKEAQRRRIAAKRAERARKKVLRDEMEAKAREEAKTLADLAEKERAAKEVEQFRARRLRDQARDAGIDDTAPLEEIEARLKALRTPIERLTMFNRVDNYLGETFSVERAEAIKEALRDRTIRNEDLDNLEFAIYRELSWRPLDTTNVKLHGMTEARPMTGVMLDGIEVRWEDVGRIKTNVTTTFVNLYVEEILGNKIPANLLRANSGIYFTEQSNSEDAYFAKAYDKPGFVSAATGGDGNVVVYGGRGISLKALAHESGHNLAAEVYGSPNPEVIKVKIGDERVAIKSEYQMILDAGKAEDGTEFPPTAYAGVNSAEDFAESVAMYTYDRKGLKRYHPKRFALIEKLLRNEGEEIVRAAIRGDLKEVPEEFLVDLPEFDPEAPPVAPVRKGETEEERKLRRKLEHARWKERKRLEAEALAKEGRGDTTPVTTSSPVIEPPKVASTPTIPAAPGTKKPRKEETEEERKARRKAEHARWKERKAREREEAERAAGLASKDLEEEIKRAAEATKELDRKAAEVARAEMLAEESRRATEEAERRVREAKEKEEREREEERRRKEHEEFLRLERLRIEAEEAARIAAEEEAERLRKVAEKKAKRAETHRRWKERKDAEKAAAAVAAALAAPGTPTPTSRALDAIETDLSAHEKKLADLVYLKASGIPITPDEDAYIKAGRSTTSRLEAERDEAIARAAKEAEAKRLALKSARLVSDIAGEISLIDLEVGRIRAKRLLGEPDSPEEKAFMDTRRKELDLLWEERKRSEAEDAEILAEEVRLKKPGEIPLELGPKIYKPVLVAEGEITRIKLDVIRLERRERAGESLTSLEYDRKLTAPSRIMTWEKEVASSKEEDKELKRKAATRASLPPKKYRHVASLESELTTFGLEESRLRRKRARGETLTPDDIAFLDSYYFKTRAIEDELVLSREEDIGREAIIATGRTVSSAVKLSTRPPQKKVDEMAERIKDDLRIRGVDPDEALKVFKELIDTHPVCIQTKVDILGFWAVGEERFKTQFETGASMGANNQQLRADAEHAGLGYSNRPDVERSLRPVYGYVNVPGNRAGHYGGRASGLRWVVKDEVRARMTTTMGDSLYPMKAGSQMGTPMLDPGFEGIGSSFTQESLIRYMESKRTKRDKEAFMSAIGYIEWQCQNQLSLSDCEAVEDVGGVLTREQKKWITDRGIKIL